MVGHLNACQSNRNGWRRHVSCVRSFRVIDSYETNHKLGIGFEARIGNGKLMVLALDTKKEMEKRPATQQLLVSIDRYVKSDRFNPQVDVEASFIESFLRK